MLEELIKRKGPCLSTELTKCLIAKGLSKDAATKRVSRGFDGLDKLTCLSFPKNVKFVYLRQGYGTSEYWEALKKAILDSNSCYALALKALIQHGGVMKKSHFFIACGAPVLQKKHISSDDILMNLKKAGVIEEINEHKVGDCLILSKEITSLQPNKNHFRARLVVEKILLVALRDWSRNLNLVSYNSVVLRGEKEIKFGTFLWDFTAPSYLHPLTKYNGKKFTQGAVVCDIFLGADITHDGIKPFLNKCSATRSLKNLPRCLQIFIAEHYTKEAFDVIKEAGVIPATPKTLFGEDVANGLKLLIELLEKAAISSANPEILSKLFNSLGKIEGAGIHLRGTLFEFIVFHLIKSTISADMKLNEVCTSDDGKIAEIDVLAVEKNRTVRFIECKGYSSLNTVTNEEVKKWLTKRIPTLRKAALRHPDWKNLKMVFELWSTGKLEEETIEMINKASTDTSKYTIKYRDSNYIYKYAEKVKDKNLINILNEHFFKNKLSSQFK